MLRPLERKLNVTALEPTEFYKMKYNLPREEKPKEVVGLAPILRYDCSAQWHCCGCRYSRHGTDIPFRCRKQTFPIMCFLRK